MPLVTNAYHTSTHTFQCLIELTEAYQLSYVISDKFECLELLQLERITRHSNVRSRASSCGNTETLGASQKLLPCGVKLEAIERIVELNYSIQCSPSRVHGIRTYCEYLLGH